MVFPQNGSASSRMTSSRTPRAKSPAPPSTSIGYDTYTPGRITVRNAAGTVVDPFDLRSYTLFVNGSIQTRDSEADSKGARLDATRKFFADAFKFSAKAGVAVKEEY